MGAQPFFKTRNGANLPRDIAIYRVRLHCRESLTRVGRHFMITNYNTVSSAVEWIKARKEADKTLQNHLKEIEAMLRKSQKQSR
jgi:chromosomal replication initiation ATPase DnaA